MPQDQHRFKITFCVTCGYRPRAVKLQLELEEAFGEDTELVQASGGLFEVEDGDIVLFSKQKEDRFPEDGEIINILHALKQGHSLLEAQAQAKASIPAPPTFEEWFTKRMGDNSSKFPD